MRDQTAASPRERRRPDKRREDQSAAQRAEHLRPQQVTAPQRERRECRQHGSDGEPEAAMARRERRRHVDIAERGPAATASSRGRACGDGGGSNASGISRAIGRHQRLADDPVSVRVEVHPVVGERRVRQRQSASPRSTYADIRIAAELRCQHRAHARAAARGATALMYGWVTTSTFLLMIERELASRRGPTRSSAPSAPSSRDPATWTSGKACRRRRHLRERPSCAFRLLADGAGRVERAGRRPRRRVPA